MGYTQRRAWCWRVTRLDGAVLRFTDHDVDLDVWFDPDDMTSAETFTAAYGGNPSATAQTADLADQTLTFVAALKASTGIIDTDVLAKRYHDARVDAYLVDWLFPWFGPMRTMRWRVASLDLTGDRVTMTLHGPEYALAQPIGLSVTRNCRANLGDGRCKFDLVNGGAPQNGAPDPALNGQQYVFGGVGIVAVGTDKRAELTVNITDGQILGADVQGMTGDKDNWFKFGKIEFTSGIMDGLAFDIAEHTQEPTQAVLRLAEQTPFDMTTAMLVTVTAGCDKKIETCFAKFNNPLNYRGLHKIQGPDKLQKTPNQKLFKS